MVAEQPRSSAHPPCQAPENLYDVPPAVGAALWELTRRVAVALRRTSNCSGTSTRQHNEPAGGQDVWHLHVHVFPRHEGDGLYELHNQARWVTPDERRPYADALREALREPG